MTYKPLHISHAQILTSRAVRRKVLQKGVQLRQKFIRKEASKLRRRRLKLSGFKKDRKERKKIGSSGSSGGVIIESAAVETGDNSQDSGSVAATQP